MEIKIHAALSVTRAQCFHMQNTIGTSSFLQTKQKNATYLSAKVKETLEKLNSDSLEKKNLESLSFIYLFIFLIVFLTKLYWHFLEPKLANKYNEMLKRTIEFQIQYSSQNMSDQETYVLLLQVTTDKSMRLPFQRDHRWFNPFRRHWSCGNKTCFNNWNASKEMAIDLCLACTRLPIESKHVTFDCSNLSCR